MGILVMGDGCWAVRKSAQPGAWSLDCQKDCVALELT